MTNNHSSWKLFLMNILMICDGELWSIMGMIKRQGWWKDGAFFMKLRNVILSIWNISTGSCFGWTFWSFFKGEDYPWKGHLALMEKCNRALQDWNFTLETIKHFSRKLFWMNILMFWPRNFIFMVEGEELKLQECFVQDRIEEQG